MNTEELGASSLGTTISSLASQCSHGFTNLTAEADRVVESNRGDDLEEAIHDARGRFNVWAANLGALQLPHSSRSLDSRLRDAALMRSSITSGLERLADVQTRGRFTRYKYRKHAYTEILT